MMRFLREFLLTAFLAALFSSSVFSQTASISGKVTYADDSALDNASVQIVKLKISVATDLNGLYEIRDVPPGTYTIVVHQEGFSDSSKVVELKPGEAVRLDFSMKISALREEVTVTASGSEETIVESIASTTSVGVAAIAEKASSSIGEVLETETGVAKRSFGPGSSRPVIRGFDGDRVLVLEDGVRSGSVGSQSGDHGEAIDPLGAERIEVVKGPATLLYGSNALGGVVNVIGNDENVSHEGFRGNMTVLGGTADKQAGVAGGLEYGHNAWLFRGSVSAQRASDYRSPIGYVENSASRSNSYSFGTGYFADKAYVNATYSFDLKRYGIPYAAYFEGEDVADGLGSLPVVDADVDIRMRQHKFRLNGGFRNLANAFISGVQYNVDYSDYRHKEIETVDGVDDVGTTFQNNTVSYRTMFEQTKTGKLSGRFGAEGFSRNYESVGLEQLIDGPVDHNSISFFGLEELTFERVKFQFGARVENNRYNPSNAMLVDRSFTGLSGSAGVNIGLWTGGAFVANYTNSYRAPALEELYNNGPHVGTVTYEIGNEELENERANGIDFSIRHLGDKLRFSAGYFYYHINNFVFLAPQDLDGDGQVDIEDGLPVAKYSQANSVYYGGEFDVNYHFNDLFGIYVGGDIVRAKLIDPPTDLIRIPPARLKAGLDINYKGLNIKPEGIFANKQDKVFPLETPTAGYGIFNIAGSYIVGQQHFAHIFTFNAFNLTDKLYRNHVSYIKDLAPEIGRGLKVSYSIRFF